jgi:hypothetical protein
MKKWKILPIFARVACRAIPFASLALVGTSLLSQAPAPPAAGQALRNRSPLLEALADFTFVGEAKIEAGEIVHISHAAKLPEGGRLKTNVNYAFRRKKSLGTISVETMVDRVKALNKILAPDGVEVTGVNIATVYNRGTQYRIEFQHGSSKHQGVLFNAFNSAIPDNPKLSAEWDPEAVVLFYRQ